MLRASPVASARCCAPPACVRAQEAELRREASRVDPRDSSTVFMGVPGRRKPATQRQAVQTNTNGNPAAIIGNGSMRIRGNRCRTGGRHR